jgi:hypothetical protein
VTVVEFALVAPVFLLFLVGGLDLGQMVYGQSVLNGAVQDAARNSTLEGGNIAAIDAEVGLIVRNILPGAKVTGLRKSYYDFTDIGRAEKWNDANGNGTCDNGETYTDENSSGIWESDIGKSGNGGANDVILYTVTATYDPIFEIPILPERWRGPVTLQSVTVRKNQPFNNQQKYATVVGTC